MTKYSSKPRSVPGPNGLLITAANFYLYPSSSPVKVTPFYAPDGVHLSVPRFGATSFKLTFGGALVNVPAADHPIAVSGGTTAIAFDSNNDRNTDSFFFSDYTLSYPTLKLFGLLLSDVDIKLRDLSNHPALLQSTGVAGGSWLGSIGVAARQLSFASVPALTLSPVSSGSSAIEAAYNLATGDLNARLGQLSYSSADTALTLASTQLTISNSAKDITLAGVGSLSLPRFGLTGLEGSFDVQVANELLQHVRGTINATTPLGSLGLGGTLGFDYDVPLRTGSITLSQGQLLGVSGLEGRLSLGPQAISGALSWTPDAPALSLGGLALKPMGGALTLDYNTLSSAPSGTLRLTDLSLAVDVGSSSAAFTGDITLELSPTGSPQFSSSNLRLASDLDVNLDGFRIKLISNDPLAPARISFINSNGSLQASLSGKVVFEDLAGLSFVIPEGGLVYDTAGWQFRDVQLNLTSPVAFGPVRFGPNASVRLTNGTLVVEPDLSLNLDSFNLSLQPFGKLIQTTVVPITKPIVDLYTTDIDFNSSTVIRQGLERIRSISGIDMPTAWAAVVAYFEDVPGNPYRDQKLSLGELLDFVNYQAFLFVQRDPGAAAAMFKSVFNSNLPQWLADLPAGISYAPLSMSGTVGKIQALRRFAASLGASALAEGPWQSIPVAFQLNPGTSQPSLIGGDSALATLLQELSKLAPGLQSLDVAHSASSQIQTTPLNFDYSIQIPLFREPLRTLVSLMSGRSFDVISSDFSLGGGLSYTYKLPLASLAAAIPPAAGILAALNASLNLTAALRASLSVSLGLSSTPAVLGGLVEGVRSGSLSMDAATHVLAGRDSITGQPLGFYLSQPKGRNLFELSPTARIGLGLDTFAVDAEAYAQVNGTLGLSVNSNDPANRIYLAKLPSSLSGLPGMKGTADISGELGLLVDTIFGSTNPNYRFPIVQNATLFSSIT